MIEKALREVGVPAVATRVYSQILKLKSATARQLAESLGMTRPSVYDQIKILQKKGLIIELEADNKKTFQVEDVSSVGRMLHKKIEDLKKDESDLKKVLPELIKKSGGTEPRIKFYPGKDGYRRVLGNLLWVEDTEVLAMWSPKEITEIAGEEYLKNFTKRRTANNIEIKSIWPEEDKGFEVDLKDEKVKLAPKEMKWSSAHLIYEDKTSFISSSEESFGFIIHSQDYADLMRQQFEQIWKMSKPIRKN